MTTPTTGPDDWCHECGVHWSRAIDGYRCPVCAGRNAKAALAARTALGWVA